MIARKDVPAVASHAAFKILNKLYPRRVMWNFGQYHAMPPLLKKAAKRGKVLKYYINHHWIDEDTLATGEDLISLISYITGAGRDEVIEELSELLNPSDGVADMPVRPGERENYYARVHRDPAPREDLHKVVLSPRQRAERLLQMAADRAPHR